MTKAFLLYASFFILFPYRQDVARSEARSA
jgi:hypothetical protein